MTTDSFFRQGIWVTRDGAQIHVSNIEDRHLLNIYDFLKRKAEKQARENLVWYATCEEPNGDMASLAFEQEFAYWNGEYEDPAQDLLEQHPFYEYLMTELKKRGLA